MRVPAVAVEQITGVVLAVCAGGMAGERVAAWQQANSRAHERTAQLLAELRAVASPDAAMLSVALRELRALG